MRQTYNLNLETVLSTLTRRQVTGLLSTDLASGKGGREQGHIEIMLNHGKIQSCELRNGSKIIKGEEALRIVAKLGVLPWIFEPSSAQSFVQQSPSLHGTTTPHNYPQVTNPNTPVIRQWSPASSSGYYWIPRKTVLLSTADLARLPRPHFQVYANIDGNRSINEIAILLRTTPDKIEIIARDLMTWGLITNT